MSNKKIYFNYSDKVYVSKYDIGIIVHTEKDNDNTCVVKFENCNKYYYEIKYSKLKKFKQKNNENK